MAAGVAAEYSQNVQDGRSCIREWLFEESLSSLMHASQNQIVKGGARAVWRGSDEVRIQCVRR